jgi:hypothetical protein
MTVATQNCVQEYIKFGECLLLFSSYSCPLCKNLEIKIHKTIVLPVGYYGCVTWSLTLREEHRLRVFKKRVLRRIFGPKIEEVAGGWRRLHREKCHNLYASPDITWAMKS